VIAEAPPPASLPPVEKPPPAPAKTARVQHPTSVARAETVFFQTVHGMALGAEICAIALCNETQPWVASLMLGAGAGFGLSFHLSSGGVTPGFARALTDGTLWGAANGLALMGVTAAVDHSSHESATVGAFLALGQLGGLGLAAGVANALQPTAGQVSLTMSGGIWSLVVASELLGMAQPNHMSGQTASAILMGLGNAGVVGAALLARAKPMPASRVLLLDAGGLLGTLTGLGIAGIAQGRTLDATPTLGACLVGTLGGLAIAYYVTQDWNDDDESEPHASFDVVPAPGGAVATLHGRF